MFKILTFTYEPIEYFKYVPPPTFSYKINLFPNNSKFNSELNSNQFNKFKLLTINYKPIEYFKYVPPPTISYKIPNIGSYVPDIKIEQKQCQEMIEQEQLANKPILSKVLFNLYNSFIRRL